MPKPQPEVVPMVLDHGKQTLSPIEPLSHGDCIALNDVGIPLMYRGELARLRAENTELIASNERLKTWRREAQDKLEEAIEILSPATSPKYKGPLADKARAWFEKNNYFLAD